MSEEISFTIGELKTEIAPKEFIHQTSITDVDLKNVKSVGDMAFIMCENLTTVYGMERLTKIGKFAFAKTKLKEIILNPDQTVEVGPCAFSNINDTEDGVVEHVNLGACTHIPAECFASTKISRLVITNKTKIMDPKAFTACTVTKCVYDGSPEEFTVLTEGVDVSMLGDVEFLKESNPCAIETSKIVKTESENIDACSIIDNCFNTFDINEYEEENNNSSAEVVSEEAEETTKQAMYEITIMIGSKSYKMVLDDSCGSGEFIRAIGSFIEFIKSTIDKFLSIKDYSEVPKLRADYDRVIDSMMTLIPDYTTDESYKPEKDNKLQTYSYLLRGVFDSLLFHQELLTISHQIASQLNTFDDKAKQIVEEDYVDLSQLSEGNQNGESK